MKKDEIKQMYSMRDILARYNIFPNRAGFIRCPFHQGDNTASMKIYKDSFHCFGCGADGDIFKFIMMMDGISFKDAFISLGGTYEKPESKNDQRHRVRDIKTAQLKREKEKQRIQKMKKRILDLSEEARLCESFAHCYVPLSDPWCECMEGYERAMQEYLWLWEEVHKDGNKC